MLGWTDRSRLRPLFFRFGLAALVPSALFPAQLVAQTPETEENEDGRRVIPFALPFASSDVGNGALANLIFSDKTADGSGENTLIFAGAATDIGLRVAIVNGRFKRDGGWVLAAQVGLFENPNAFYFGHGNFQDLQRIERVKEGREHTAATLPATADVWPGRDFSLNRNYLDDLARRQDRRIEPDEINSGREPLRQQQNHHYNYHLKRNIGKLSVQKSLGDTPFNLVLGFAGARVRTYSYRGDREEGDFFPEVATLLDLDRPVGYDSTERTVHANTARIGLEYDSLPAERHGHPNRGMRSGLHFEGAGTNTGSHYTYDRVVAYHHQYIELFPDFFGAGGRELVLAYRLFGIQTFGDIPFFQEKGLGGSLLRGYPANQFIDRVVVGGSLELRYTLLPAAKPGGTSLGLVVFADSGRVAARPEEIDSYGWHRAAGAGLNIIFGDKFVIELLGGRSQYQRFFVLRVGHTFAIRL